MSAVLDHVREAVAISRFVDWLYDDGPDPNVVKRERLIKAYREHMRERNRALDREPTRRKKLPPLKVDGPPGQVVDFRPRRR